MNLRNLLVVMVSGVLLSIPATLVSAAQQVPQTSLEFYNHMDKLKGKFYVKSRTTEIDRAFKPAVMSFWEKNSECFNITVERHAQRSTFHYKLDSVKKYVPSMRWLGKHKAIYGLQMARYNSKGKLSMGNYKGKMHPDGTFIIATKFERLGKNRTRISSYFIGGPVPKMIVKASEKWAMGKKAKCPRKYL